MLLMLLLLLIRPTVQILRTVVHCPVESSKQTREGRERQNNLHAELEGQGISGANAASRAALHDIEGKFGPLRSHPHSLLASTDSILQRLWIVLQTLSMCDWNECVRSYVTPRKRGVGLNFS